MAGEPVSKVRKRLKLLEVRDDDRWTYRSPLTKTELAEERADTQAWELENFGMKADKYTCDECGHAQVCTLVFDSYNTSGDCLMEK